MYTRLLQQVVDDVTTNPLSLSLYDRVIYVGRPTANLIQYTCKELDSGF